MELGISMWEIGFLQTHIEKIEWNFQEHTCDLEKYSRNANRLCPKFPMGLWKLIWIFVGQNIYLNLKANFCFFQKVLLKLLMSLLNVYPLKKEMC